LNEQDAWRLVNAARRQYSLAQQELAKAQDKFKRKRERSGRVTGTDRAALSAAADRLARAEAEYKRCSALLADAQGRG